jgi:hypothetical protein
MEPPPQPAGDAEPETTGVPGEPANVVEEMEVEQAMLDGEAEGGGLNRQNVWKDPYEWLPVSDVFPGGPSDTTVLTGYPRHVARYIYMIHM